MVTLKAQREDLARLITLEAAKPIRTARAEVKRAIAIFTDALEECKRIRGEWLPLDPDAASEGSSALVRRFPIGPAAAITPFNFPLNLAGHKVAPALAGGNTMLLKPAPQAPLSALHHSYVSPKSLLSLPFVELLGNAGKLRRTRRGVFKEKLGVVNRGQSVVLFLSDLDEAVIDHL